MDDKVQKEGIVLQDDHYCVIASIEQKAAILLTMIYITCLDDFCHHAASSKTITLGDH